MPPIRQVGAHQVLPRQLGTNPAGGSSTAPVIPGYPWFYFDSRNVDGLGNFGTPDLSALSAWKNIGTDGASRDLAQATGAAQPIFHTIGTPGKLNNFPSVRFDTTKFMASAVGTARSLPCKVAGIFRVDSFGASYGLFDGQTGGRAGAYTNSTSGLLHVTGTGDGLTTASPTAGQYHAMVFHYATGANSYARLNGVQAPNVTAGPQAMTGITLGGLIGGIFLFPGDCVVLAGWDLLTTLNASVTDTGIESFLTSTWGAMPQ